MISAETGLFLDGPTTIVKHSINVHKDIVSPTKAKDTIMIKTIKFTLFRC